MSFSREPLSIKQKYRQSMRKKKSQKDMKSSMSLKNHELQPKEVLTYGEMLHLEMAFDELDTSCEGFIPGNCFTTKIYLRFLDKHNFL